MKVKRRAESMRMKGSSESLILSDGGVNRVPKISIGGVRCKEVGSIQVIPVLQIWYRFEQRSWQRETPVPRHDRSAWALVASPIFRRIQTHIAAMSFTPKHFLTSCTIIFIFPPSPVSPESGTEIGGPGASSSTWWSSLSWSVALMS